CSRANLKMRLNVSLILKRIERVHNPIPPPISPASPKVSLSGQ
ncbi:MAG: hypothetical protein ACI9XZ_003380, partial [Alphaproteobacteria bacterium]